MITWTGVISGQYGTFSDYVCMGVKYGKETMKSKNDEASVPCLRAKRETYEDRTPCIVCVIF